MKHRFNIDSEADKQRLAQRIADAPFTAPFVVEADVSDGRTLPQNAHLHPVMRTIAKHMMTHGAPRWTEYRWRHYFVAKYFGQDVVADPDGSGGVIVLHRAVGTSGLSKKEAADMLDWLYAFGAEIGVEWAQ